MANLAKLVVGALGALFSCWASAQQWTVLPPAPGWTPSGGGSYQKPVGAGSLTLGRWPTATTFSTSGRALTVPTYLPATAATRGAALTALRLTPGGLLTSTALGWLLQWGLERINDEWMRREEDRTPQQGYYWTHNGGGTACKSAAQQCTYRQAENAAQENLHPTGGSKTAQGASVPRYLRTTAAGQLVYEVDLWFTWNTPSNPLLHGTSGSDLVELYGTPGAPAEEPTYRPATPADWELVDETSMPDSVLDDIAGKRPLPVGVPVIQPQRIPLGPPVPVQVEEGQPQQWRQPVIDLVPRNTQSEPWRVEVIPKDIPTQDGEGLDEPEVLDPESSDGTPRTGDARQLCDVYPDILACQKLGTIEPEELEERRVPLEITAQSGFGEGAGSCPEPRTGVFMGQQLSMSWQPMCDFAVQIRPVVVAVAWLSAAFGFMGLSRREG